MDNRDPNLLRAQRRPPCRWQRLVSTMRRQSAILCRIVLPMLESQAMLSLAIFIERVNVVLPNTIPKERLKFTLTDFAE